jgi:light-regulated signal transduction histidine kinase (bacteriophytochrome)
MQALINSLLEYARVESQGKSFRLVDMRKAVNDALTHLRAALDECGADVRIGELPTVFGDQDQLARLFQNLIGNALKFRGEVPPRIEVAAEELADSWRLSVRDNGIGLEQQYAERIFIIFQRLHTRGQFPGTGLGLAISKRVVERHGGRIWVESEAGQGSTFYFTLPKQSDKHAAVIN